MPCSSSRRSCRTKRNSRSRRRHSPGRRSRDPTSSTRAAGPERAPATKAGTRTPLRDRTDPRRPIGGRTAAWRNTARSCQDSSGNSRRAHRTPGWSRLADIGGTSRSSRRGTFAPNMCRRHFPLHIVGRCTARRRRIHIPRKRCRSFRTPCSRSLAGSCRGCRNTPRDTSASRNPPRRTRARTAAASIARRAPRTADRCCRRHRTAQRWYRARKRRGHHSNLRSRSTGCKPAVWSLGRRPSSRRPRLPEVPRQKERMRGSGKRLGTRPRTISHGFGERYGEKAGSGRHLTRTTRSKWDQLPRSAGSPGPSVILCTNRGCDFGLRGHVHGNFRGGHEPCLTIVP